MKMLWVVLKPALVEPVIVALERAGTPALTRLPLTGSGAGCVPLPPGMEGQGYTILMIAVPDNEVARTVAAIRAHAREPEPESAESPGGINGKIFITFIDAAYTIRTASRPASGNSS